MADTQHFVEIRHAEKHYGSLQVLKDISLTVERGQIVAIIGPSGSGKSTLLRAINDLDPLTGGEVWLEDTQVNKKLPHRQYEKHINQVRQDIGMVFQHFNLFPHLTVRENIKLAPKMLKGLSDADADKLAEEQLTKVGMIERIDYYPSQLSGGQKQRVGIARAFAGGARIVVADEPVSALDVSVQAAVTDLLMEIQREQKTTLLFISHDLSIVRYLSDRVMVMYLGHVVELGTTDQVFAPPYHPYTEALLSAVPIADTSVEKTHIVLEGDIPSAMDPPPGCPFQTRCRWKSQVPGNLCEEEVPPMRDLGGNHQVKCHLSEADFARMEPVIKIAAE